MTKGSKPRQIEVGARRWRSDQSDDDALEHNMNSIACKPCVWFGWLSNCKMRSAEATTMSSNGANAQGHARMHAQSQLNGPVECSHAETVSRDLKVESHCSCITYRVVLGVEKCRREVRGMIVPDAIQRPLAGLQVYAVQSAQDQSSKVPKFQSRDCASPAHKQPNYLHR